MSGQPRYRMHRPQFAALSVPTTRLHMQSHKETKMEFPCQEEGCEAIFESYHNRRNHMQKEHSGKVWACEEDGCGKTFQTAGGLSNHKVTHKKKKDWPCQWEGCGKT